MMKSGLSQSGNTHSVLPLELQRAIQLLQLSSIELEHEIIKNVTENPLLHFDNNQSFIESYNDETITQNVSLENEDPDENELALLTYNLFSNDSFDIEPLDKTDETLQAHLMWQLNYYPLSELEHAIASYIISSINDDGFFTGTIEEIQSILPLNVNTDKIQNILHLIHFFEPFGVGVKDTKAFLLLQMKQLQHQHPKQLLRLAEKIILNDFNTLALHDYNALAKIHNVSEDDIHAAIHLITSLKIMPNVNSDIEPLLFIQPDIRIYKEADTWQLEIIRNFNDVSLDKENLKLLKQKNNKKVVIDYLKEKLHSAKWLLTCLAHRESTLYKVTEAIFNHQQAFLSKGTIAIVPLTLKQIAADTGLHESSISRIVSNKFIETPFGVFPLKYFFASHINSNKKEISNKAVIFLIKQLIATESREKPLSDQQVTNKLKQQYGLTIPRRTVSKYRKQLNILPAKFRQKCVNKGGKLS